MVFIKLNAILPRNSKPIEFMVYLNMNEVISIIEPTRRGGDEKAKSRLLLSNGTSYLVEESPQTIMRMIQEAERR